MARPARELEDLTPLAGARIDVPARIGWLLRSWRTASDVGLREVAERLTAAGRRGSPATLSRMEVGGARSGVVQDAYEAALGLPYGALRMPIDVLCRTFTYAPADADPLTPPDDLAAFSAACDAVAHDPSGPDWLRFAEHHVHGSFGLPASAITPLVGRLVSEMPRATGAAYATRYEGLAKLRCSPYGDVVESVIRDAVAVPGAQRLADLLSAATERATPELLAWCGSLLHHESPAVAHAACLGIQNLRSVGGLDTATWLALAPTYADACDRYGDDAARIGILTDTWAACGPEFRAAVQQRIRRPLPQGRRPAHWTPGRRNKHHALCVSLASEITGDGPGTALLARLLFEVLYDFRATIVVTSSFLLAGSPFATKAQQLFHDLALSDHDDTTRHGAAYAFANLMLPFESVDPEPWLGSPDPVIRRAGLTVAGFAAHHLPEPALRGLLTDGDPATRTDALFAAGMAQHPALAAFAADPGLDPGVRSGAAWWRRAGGRICR